MYQAAHTLFILPADSIRSCTTCPGILQDLDRFTITLAYFAHNWDSRKHLMKPFIQQLPALGTELRRLCAMACLHGPVQVDILRIQQGDSSCSPRASCDSQDESKCHHDQLACAAAVHELLTWPQCCCGVHPSQTQVLARALMFMIEMGHLPSIDQKRISDAHSLPREPPRLRNCNGEELCFYSGNPKSDAVQPLHHSRRAAIDAIANKAWTPYKPDQRPCDQRSCVFVGGGRDYSWRGSCCGLRYSPGDDAWVAAGPALRDGVTFASVASIGNTVYMFGNSHPPACSAVCTDSSWKSLPVHNFYAGLQFAAVEAVAGEIWVAGGRSLPNKVCTNWRSQCDLHVPILQF